MMDEKTASSLIGRVRADDLERARTAIGNGVQCAEDQWIESGLIADALASELIKVALASQSGAKIAETSFKDHIGEACGVGWIVMVAE